VGHSVLTYAVGWSGRRESNPHRELGKLPRTAPYGAILKLGGNRHRPLLSVNDRCRPMLKARPGTAGESEHGSGLAPMAPPRRQGEARSRRPLPRWQGAARPRGSRWVGFEAAFTLLQRPRSSARTAGDLRFLDARCDPRARREPPGCDAVGTQRGPAGSCPAVRGRHPASLSPTTRTSWLAGRVMVDRALGEPPICWYDCSAGTAW
jgi:hypothetical protein